MSVFFGSWSVLVGDSHSSIVCTHVRRDKGHADVLEVLATFMTSYTLRKARRLLDDYNMYVCVWLVLRLIPLRPGVWMLSMSLFTPSMHTPHHKPRRPGPSRCRGHGRTAAAAARGGGRR